MCKSGCINREDAKRRITDFFGKNQQSIANTTFLSELAGGCKCELYKVLKELLMEGTLEEVAAYRLANRGS